MSSARSTLRLLMLAVLALGSLLVPTAAQAADAGTSAGRIRTAPPLHAGEDMTSGSGYHCIASYLAYSGPNYYVITAGHCTSAASDWYIGGHYLGSTTGSSFPGNDYGLIQIADPDYWDPQPGIIHSGGVIKITGVGTATVGATVCIVSRVTGVHCGTVTGLNQTVNYPEGTVYGLGSANICTEAGDSGAPVYSGDKAIGIVVGGSGNCSSGGELFFQPLAEILSAYGLTLL